MSSYYSDRRTDGHENPGDNNFDNNNFCSKNTHRSHSAKKNNHLWNFRSIISYNHHQPHHHYPLPRSTGLISVYKDNTVQAKLKTFFLSNVESKQLPSLISVGKCIVAWVKLPATGGWWSNWYHMWKFLNASGKRECDKLQ